MTTIHPKYPKHLLTASDKDRLHYFVVEVIVGHPSLNRIVDEIDEKACSLLERRLLLLVGGTGTGKSAALRLLTSKRIAKNAAAIAADHQVVPAICFEIEAPHRGKFEFSSLYSAGLREMNAALVERTLPTLTRVAGKQSTESVAVESAGRRTDADGLKTRFIKNLDARQIEVVCLDEAINIFKVGRARSEKDRKEQLKEQADRLKSFVNINTPTTLVLAGAYDFYDLILTSGQNARRSRIVHLEPYTMSVDGLKGFVDALIELIAHLPIEHSLVPEQIATELFLQCLGCVGILKNILNEALYMAQISDRHLTMVHVRRSYYATAQLDVMRSEMELGIKLVREVMTTAQLAEHAKNVVPDPPQQPARSISLKPGETKPSHRHNAADGWDK